MQPPFASVIIPVRNRSDQLKRCLDSLLRQTYPSDRTEVIVCDNNSTENISLITDPYPNVTLVTESRTGPAAARNTACRIAKGDILAFIDSDCIADERWLQNAVDALCDSRVDSVAGRVVMTFQNPKKPACMELYDFLTNFRQEMYVRRYHFSVTANLITRKSVFDEVGEFDDQNFLFAGEDCDWGVRHHTSGKKMEYRPDVTIYHPAQRSLVVFLKKYVGIVRAAVVLRRKHGTFGEQMNLMRRLFHEDSRLTIILVQYNKVRLLMLMGLLSIHGFEVIAHAYVKIRYDSPFRRR